MGVTYLQVLVHLLLYFSKTKSCSAEKGTYFCLLLWFDVVVKVIWLQVSACHWSWWRRNSYLKSLLRQKACLTLLLVRTRDTRIMSDFQVSLSKWSEEDWDINLLYRKRRTGIREKDGRRWKKIIEDWFLEDIFRSKTRKEVKVRSERRFERDSKVGGGR